jgi:hypothetical protein
LCWASDGFFQKFTHLRTLSFPASPFAGADLSLLTLFTNLESLTFEGILEPPLVYLQNLPKLSKLKCFQGNVNFTALAPLQQLTALSAFTLSGLPPDPSPYFPNLKRLACMSHDIDASATEILGRWTSLRSLRCYPSENLLLSEMTNLTQLFCSKAFSDIPSEIVTKLVALGCYDFHFGAYPLLTNLRKLWCDSEDLSELIKLTTLGTLGCELVEEDESQLRRTLTKLSNLVSYERVYVSWPGKNIARPENLRHLECFSTSKIPSNLSKMTNLTLLHLPSLKCDPPKVWSVLTQLTSLHELIMGNMELPEKVLRALPKLTRLERLRGKDSEDVDVFETSGT